MQHVVSGNPSYLFFFPDYLYAVPILKILDADWQDF